MKYLPLYYKWMSNGLPDKGLCNSFKGTSDILFHLFEDEGLWFWGYNGEDVYSSSCHEIGITKEQLKYEFTPLRQTIVLFLAAMNNEL